MLSRPLRLNTSNDRKSSLSCSSASTHAPRSTFLRCSQREKALFSILRSEDGAVKDSSPVSENAKSPIFSSASPANVTRFSLSQY